MTDSPAKLSSRIDINAAATTAYRFGKTVMAWQEGADFFSVYDLAERFQYNVGCPTAASAALAHMGRFVGDAHRFRFGRYLSAEKLREHHRARIHCLRELRPQQPQAGALAAIYLLKAREYRLLLADRLKIVRSTIAREARLAA